MRIFPRFLIFNSCKTCWSKKILYSQKVIGIVIERKGKQQRLYSRWKLINLTALLLCFITNNTNLLYNVIMKKHTPYYNLLYIRFW